MANNCDDFGGNADLYGLGIRVGFYFNWLATCISNNYVRKEAPSMRALNGTFHLALLGALIQGGTHLQVIDAYILLVFRVGDISLLTALGLLINSGDSKLKCPSMNFFYESVTLIGILSRLIVAIIFDGYSVYYWFNGMEKMEGASCQMWGFFFARVNLFGWLRRLVQAICIIQCIFGGFLFFALAQKLEYVHIGRVLTETLFTPAPPRNPTSSKRSILTGLVLPMLNLLLVAWVILVTELIIRWNNIPGGYNLKSAGQLIPAVIGVGSFVKVLLSFVIERRNCGEEDDIWDHGPE